MIKLHGASISNYVNKVKLGILEKGLEYEQVRVAPSQEEEFLKISPMGKIPVLEMDGKFIFESGAILEFLDTIFPQTPKLIPEDSWEAARVREISTIIETYLDIPARRIYLPATRGKEVSPEIVEEVHPILVKGIKALQRVVRFSPYIAGEVFTMADCSGFAHLSVLDEELRPFYPDNHPLDLLNGWKEYFTFMKTKTGPALVEKEKQTLKKILARAKTKIE
ncbi:glutathione S-transferase [Leptospira noguchii]|uniref:Glutathione S-transferase family protein n=1 Tax=Leptospira noguchii serovar Autumnalis str. ZUN142 TaxID=1085540 RepID=M6U8H6_9LEPT|nr:glutathione S-transferase N-terminal domain-containing protein [Leptospira noguchii]EKR74321.1 glutathione S-transferase family protein [Leptospira noguchii str. 2006001870]EMI65983.1 glutathione S-transferase family protein [Leptospira noguchii str. Bonito]EMO41337.1 glutathione S-transferase family protein [Leptospira noguchii serovar Autumnalis str. ZUN142]EMS83896.1 glutathione S-transferase family protein [Leptospira noguchii str. Hook]EMS90010.1 glutathione S-transferase family protei